MFGLWTGPQLGRYFPIKNDESLETHKAKYGPGWKSSLKTFALVLVASSIGYYFGYHGRAMYKSGLLAPTGTIERHFVYNPTFSIAPTPETEEAWKKLFPDNGGFIHHPDLATNFSGLAVFHQLHCLKALYNMHYALKEQNSGQLSTGDSPHKDHSIHARHCYDYLRQSIMCLADTNLEPYNYTLDGVTGWGRRTCRDYDSVFAFTNFWGGSKYATSYSR